MIDWLCKCCKHHNYSITQPCQERILAWNKNRTLMQNKKWQRCSQIHAHVPAVQSFIKALILYDARGNHRYVPLIAPPYSYVLFNLCSSTCLHCNRDYVIKLQLYFIKSSQQCEQTVGEVKAYMISAEHHPPSSMMVEFCKAVEKGSVLYTSLFRSCTKVINNIS